MNNVIRTSYARRFAKAGLEKMLVVVVVAGRASAGSSKRQLASHL